MASHCRRRNAIHFFKIILEYSLQVGKLKVPDKFIRKYGGGMPNPVFLKPPDGTQWEIYWTKYESGEVWFEKGWNEVAGYYSLNHGHLVLFKYEGTCHFEVNIFDKSALEIDYPLHGNLGQISDDSDSVEILYEKPPLPKKASRKPPVSSSFCPCKKIKIGEVERTSNRPNMRPGEGNKFKSTNAELILIKHELEEDIGRSNFSAEKRPKSMATIKGREKPLTCTEKARALQKVNTFMSKNPYFKIVIQPGYIRGCLCIPANFVEQYLEKKKKKKKKEGAVLLRVSDGRTWYAKYIWAKENKHRLRITSGWISFARDNDLKVGDVCVFELTNSTGISFLVYIFGDSENQSCSQFPDAECTKLLPQAAY